MTTLRKLSLIAGVLVTAFLGFGFYQANTPDGQARSAERRVISACRDSLAQSGYNANVNAVCVRLETNYRAKWNRAP